MSRRAGRARTAGVFPATHSILSTAALVEQVLPAYDLAAPGAPVECRLLNRGLTDTYLVRAADERYVLRVYRTGWRSDAEVRYELDVLDHLGRKGVPVATPVRRKDGRLLGAVRAPEGRRQVVLFTYARGKDDRLGRGFVRNATLYGEAVAAIHAATDDFVSRNARFRIDLGHLLDQPLETIRPLLEHRPDDWHYLAGLAEKLRRRVEDLPVDALETGFCHGDFHGGNAHLDGTTLTFFDFDCCGPGWRAYDVAVFLWGWSLQRRKKADRLWAAFLKGYTKRRPLAPLDLAAVPLFVAIRHIWLLGLHTGNGHDWGFGWMNDRYFDRALKFLREWERDRIDRVDGPAAPEAPPEPVAAAAS